MDTFPADRGNHPPPGKLRGGQTSVVLETWFRWFTKRGSGGASSIFNDAMGKTVTSKAVSLSTQEFIMLHCRISVT